MKKILFALAAIPAATMAVEASAQTYASSDADMRIQNRISNLEMRYQAAVNARVLTNNERVTIGRQLANLRNLQQRYAYNGLTTSERRQLQMQIRAVRDQIKMAGGTGWANQYGWNDRDLEYGNAYGSNGYGNNAYGGNYNTQYGNSYGQTAYTYDQYGRRIAVPNVTYDQYGRPMQNGGYVTNQYQNRDYASDQYGRPVQNGYYGQGGPYEAAPRSNGIGGVLGNVLGGVVGRNSGGGLLGSILGGGGLGIGSVITGAIAQALGGGSNYGYQDRSNVYFRSDGQRVYEIDARTNQVVRIHPVR